jgi:hypothetical protein
MKKKAAITRGKRWRRVMVEILCRQCGYDGKSMIIAARPGLQCVGSVMMEATRPWNESIRSRF